MVCIRPLVIMALVFLGTRQRLALARSFYRQAKLLVLDEATSALDNRTESEVIQSLEIIGRRCTTLVIAHRLSTIIKCDRIYEFLMAKLLQVVILIN